MVCRFSFHPSYQSNNLETYPLNLCRHNKPPLPNNDDTRSLNLDSSHPTATMDRGSPHPPSSSPPPDLEIKIHPRRGNNHHNVVHPVGPPSLPPENGNSRRPGDFRPFKRWSPWLVPSFILANIVLFVIAMYVNNCPKNSVSCVAHFLRRFSFQPLKENPLLGPSSSTLEKMGALEVHKVVDKRQVWRLLSCIWLHAGVFHVLANMLSLVFIGIRLEQEFGFVRIGLLYVISGFGGSLLSALFIQSSISVGASGALFGLLGAMLSELITNWTIYENKLAALLTLVIIIVINLAVGILPHVDNFAHIGGFVSGFFLGFVFLIRPQFGWVSQQNAPSRFISTSVTPKYKTYQYVLWVISATIVIVGLTVGLVMLIRGENGNEHCSWCHYLTCVPTSKWSCKSQEVYCESSQIGNQLNLTCLTTGKSNLYMLSNDNTSRVQQLCSELCS